MCCDAAGIPTKRLRWGVRGVPGIWSHRSLLLVVPIQCLIRSCPFRPPNWDLLCACGWRTFLQLLLLWVFGAPQSAALVPPKFTSSGYYPMLNSIESILVSKSDCVGLLSDAWIQRVDNPPLSGEFHTRKGEPSYSYY